MCMSYFIIFQLQPVGKKTEEVSWNQERKLICPDNVSQVIYRVTLECNSVFFPEFSLLSNKQQFQVGSVMCHFY